MRMRFLIVACAACAGDARRVLTSNLDVTQHSSAAEVSSDLSSKKMKAFAEELLALRPSVGFSAPANQVARMSRRVHPRMAIDGSLSRRSTLLGAAGVVAGSLFAPTAALASTKSEEAEAKKESSGGEEESGPA